MKIHCQECGWIMSKPNTSPALCERCCSELAIEYQAQVRADKHFDLVKAWGPGYVVFDTGEPSICFERLEFDINEALTALYGPEPGKD